MSLRWRSAAASLLMLTGALGFVPAGPGSAMTPQASSPCVVGAAERLSAHSLRASDPAALSAARVRRFEERTSRLLEDQPRLGGAARATDPPVVIDVAVHVIRPRTDTFEVGRRKARRAVAVLSEGFAGAQHDSAYPSSFRFQLTSFDSTVNRAWYYADVSYAEQRAVSRDMKRALHVGGPETLNLYLTRPEMLLGWATFPQDYSQQPRQDGVVVSIGSLAGGDISGYNLGDTVTHEVGHWMGLYHTFQGGCSLRNDRVRDTAPEASPNFGCPARRDTCTDDTLLDPVHNFMDYSRDGCMYGFTAGQDVRMLKHWQAYRG
jgi:hypothetical protein